MLLGRLLKDQRGGVAPMFALALIPLAAAVGSGVDYAIAAKVRTQLLAAADAASIGSVSKTSVALAAAATMTGDGAIPTAEADAAKIFNAHAGTPTTYTLGNVTTKVVKSGTSVSSVVEFSAQVPTHFMGLFGYKTVPVHGTSTAANSLPTFIDFYLLLDNTPSMGVGGDAGRCQHDGREHVGQVRVRLPRPLRSTTTTTSSRRSSASRCASTCCARRRSS